MAITFTQTDTGAKNGQDIACSGASQLADNSAADCEMSEGATAGSTEQTVKNSSGVNNVAAFMCQSASGEPGTGTWESGDWTVRLDVTTGNSSVTLQEIHICEFNGGSNQGSVTSKTSLGISMTAGVHSVTITQGSDYTPVDSTSTVYIVYVMDFGGSHGNQSIGVTPSQDIGSPISAGAQTFTQSLHANATGDARLDPIASLFRSLHADAVGGADLSDTASFLKTLDADAVGEALLTTGLQFKKALDVDATGNAQLETLKAIGKVLHADATGSVGLSHVATFAQQLDASAAGGVVLSRFASFLRQLDAKASGDANLSRIAPIALQVAAIVDPRLAEALTTLESQAAQATGEAGLSVNKISASDSQSFSQSADATAEGRAELRMTFYDEHGMTWGDKRKFHDMAGRAFSNVPGGKKIRKRIEQGHGTSPSD